MPVRPSRSGAIMRRAAAQRQAGGASTFVAGTRLLRQNGGTEDARMMPFSRQGHRVLGRGPIGDRGELIVRRLTLAACLTVVLLAAGPAPAQAPSPDAMAAARELIVTMRAADNFKTILPAIVKNLKPAIVQSRPDVERDYDAIMPLILESMNARVNDMLDQMAALYAHTFTAEELREVVAFYRGPTGQKFVEKLPTITQEGMRIGQRFGQSIAGELRDRIVDELRKRGHKI
jgi:uncharacterized protein